MVGGGGTKGSETWSTAENAGWLQAARCHRCRCHFQCDYPARKSELWCATKEEVVVFGVNAALEQRLGHSFLHKAG